MQWGDTLLRTEGSFELHRGEYFRGMKEEQGGDGARLGRVGT